MYRFLMLTIGLFCSLSVFADDPKSIAEYVDGMEHKSGFYDVYYQPTSGKVFLLLDRFNEEFLFQSSLPRGVGSNDIGLDRGQLGNTRLARFNRFGDKVLLTQLNTAYRATRNNAAERQSIDEAFADSVIAGLPVVAETDGKVLVNYTDFLLSDIHGIQQRFKQRKQGSFSIDKDRSGVFLPRTKAFADNTELEALHTYQGSDPGQYVKDVTPDPISVSVHLHHSLVRLPDESYKPRKFHPYSGFWSVGFQDYSAPITDSMQQQFIPRHRLQKRNPSAAISEAVEPIVYYLDPGIPEPVKSALQEGALWWNQAFEAIGYKDAFQVKVLPADADPMDVRYNVIQWVHRATRGWSYGFSVIDPRTGEIIKGHVTLGSLRVRQDYLIALGLTSPFNTAKPNTQAQLNMALARVRQLSAHEIGHTLGIAHNFASSQNKRASVMDYPHPKVEISNGRVRLDDAYDTGIGQWDKHVIAYGYQDLPDPSSEQDYLSTLLRNTRDKGLAYQSDPDSRPAHAANAEGHLWDNGADPLQQWQRLVQVRELALKNFGLGSIKNGQALSSLEETLVPVYLMHRYQLEAVVKLIGGVHYRYEMKGDNSTPFGIKNVDSQRQQQALQTLINSLSPAFLTIPEKILALIPPKVYGDTRTRESFSSRTGVTFDPVSAAEASAGFSLSLLLQPERLNRLSRQAQQNNKQFGVDKLVATLFDKVVKATKKRAGQAFEDRVAYLSVDAVMATLSNEKLAPEVRGELLAEIISLNNWLKKQTSRGVFVVLNKQIDWYMQTGQWHSQFKAVKMPPGSPI